MVAIATSLFLTKPAQAHVKWFCAFDVAGQPRGLESVLCPDFELLVGLSIFVLAGGCLLEGTILGAALIRSLNRVTDVIHANTDLLIRASCGFLLVSLWTIGGILLTPELKTQSQFVPWLQLGLAACMLWKPTLPIAALGLAGLYAASAWTYGTFHLLDYPVFLGIALYLALIGLNRTFFGVRPIEILRWSAAVTLMWASIEKWAYPEWTFPLFVTHPKMAFGYDEEFFMRAAGAVEFTLAFSLLWTPLVRRTAAIILAATFISAVSEFGKIDAIGHAPIIAVMLAIAADRVQQTKVEPVRGFLPNRAWVKSALLIPAGYCGALVAFLAVYYGVHAMMFGTTIL